MEEDRLILLSIAAEELGYSPERLRQIIKGKSMPGVVGERRGKFYFLRESEIAILRDSLRKSQRKPRA